MTLTTVQQQQINAQPIDRTDIGSASRDIGVIMFGILAIAALLVSMPATYDIMSRYHRHDEIGLTQAVASLIVFELGAIISKLATLLFPWWKGRLTTLQIALLLFVAGANALATTAAAPAGETLQAFLFAGMLPFFQFVFLALCVARVKALHVVRLSAELVREPTQAERLQAALAEQQEKAFKAMLEQVTNQMTIATVQPAALPIPKMIGFAAKTFTPDAASPVQTNARQESSEAQPDRCPKCNEILTRGQFLAAKRYGHCNNCKG